MHERGWVELETPVLQRLTGGAAARPFVTHHNALDRELFLRTATELYLKRAIVGGFEDVYEFGKFFRNEGMSPQHNPEFTMLEMFVGGADYNGVMEFIEVLVASVVEQVMGTTVVERDGVEIDFAAPWPRVVLRDEILREAGIDIYQASRDELAEVAGEDAEENDDWAGLVDTLQGKLVEPKLIQPTYITVLPIDIWPLVKVHPDDPKVCEAFDGIVAGMEIVGGGTDINDPVEQRQPLHRPARTPGVRRRGGPPSPRRRVRAGARIRDAAGQRRRPRDRPPADDHDRLQDPARRNHLSGNARVKRRLKWR